MSEIVALNTNTVEVFNNEYFGQIRMSRDEDGEPLFCLADVCRALELTNPTMVAQQICEEFELAKLNLASFDTGFGVKEMTMITEQQLYFVMSSSRKPNAKPFRMWVNKEVLPSIRKAGSYSIVKTPIEIILQHSTNQLETAKAITEMLEIEDRKHKEELAVENKKHQEELAVEHNITKTVYSALNAVKQDYVGLYNTFIDTEKFDDMREVAAKLHIVGMGRNKLFQLLRDKGVLDSSNVPYRKYVDAGYFILSEAVRTTKKGDMKFNKVMVSQSGKVFIEKLARKG